MGERREINASAESRLNLQAALAVNHAGVLTAAFETRLEQVGGSVAMLDSVVQIATAAGYKGTMEQAAIILNREGGFTVKPGPSDRLTENPPDPDPAKNCPRLLLAKFSPTVS